MTDPAEPSPETPQPSANPSIPETLPMDAPTLAMDGAVVSGKPAGPVACYGEEAPGSIIGPYTLVEKLGEGHGVGVALFDGKSNNCLHEGNDRFFLEKFPDCDSGYFDITDHSDGQSNGPAGVFP